MRWAWAAVVLVCVAGCGDDGPGADLDAGALSLGQPCSDTRPCSGPAACLAERQQTLGSAEDPIESLPDGGVALTGQAYVDGYCAIVGTADDPYPCLPGDGTCGAEGTCVWLGDTTGCFAACTPTADDHAGCRAGYQCAFEGACMPGCTSDAECRVQRRDTDGDGELGEGDLLVYDTGSDARCDPDTFRCTHSGTAGAEAGITCAKDADCEGNGRCQVFWPDGGYCTKMGCDVPGRACAGEAVCQDNVFGVAACFRGCVVGAEAEALQLGPDGHGEGCRAGYRCLYDGAGAGGEINGACIPGNYNDVSSSNVGAPCATEAECWSPFGAGACAEGGIFGDAGYCTVLGCGAPGISGTDPCGPEAVCVPLGGGETACLATCTSAQDCQPGHGCVDRDGDPATARTCIAGCDTELDCRPGELCDPATFRCAG